MSQELDPQQLLQALQNQQARMEQMEQVIRSMATQPAPASQVNSGSFKPVKPQTFNGAPRANADAWIFEMEQYFAVTNMAPDTQTPYAVAFLRDMASTWWRSVVRQKPELLRVNWATFKEQLLTRFRPIEASKTARTMLNTLKQTGTVSDYCNTFFRQLQLIDDMAMADQIDRFTRGLKFSIAQEVDMHDPKTLEAAMNLAQRADLRLRNRRFNTFGTAPYNSYSGNRYHSVTRTVDSGPAPMELGSIEETKDGDNEYQEEDFFESEASLNAMQGDNRNSRNGNSRVPNLSKEDYQRLRREGKCFRCRQTGHVGRLCPKLHKDSNNRDRSKNPNAQ